MNKIAGCVGLFILAGFFSSCSFYKVVSGKRTKDPDKKVVWTGADTSHVATTVLPVPTMPLTDSKANTSPVNPAIGELMPVFKNRMTYKTFSGKAKMSFEGPDSKVEFTGHFRVKKDSAIWINITAIGGMIQAARIFITPDSFFMINYQQQQVTMLPLSHADKFLPAKVDFASLQNLIIGDPLREGVITDAAIQGDSMLLKVEDTSYVQNLVYNKRDSTLRKSYMRTRKPNGPIAVADFNDYAMIQGRRISTSRVINIQNGNNVYTLYMNFSKIVLDEPLDIPFSIPESYTVKP